MRRKANLYCQRATYFARWLDDKKAEAERDWDKLDDAEASDWNGFDDDDSHDEIGIEVAKDVSRNLDNFVVIYSDAIGSTTTTTLTSSRNKKL